MIPSERRVNRSLKGNLALIRLSILVIIEGPGHNWVWLIFHFCLYQTEKKEPGIIRRKNHLEPLTSFFFDGVGQLLASGWLVWGPVLGGFNRGIYPPFIRGMPGIQINNPHHQVTISIISSSTEIPRNTWNDGIIFVGCLQPSRPLILQIPHPRSRCFNLYRYEGCMVLSYWVTQKDPVLPN